MANAENEIFDMQGKLEKLGRATETTADGIDTTHKAKAIRELDENVQSTEEEKLTLAADIALIEDEMEQTMKAIKTIGLVTLGLEAELEQSWEIARKT